jgi:maltose O-acetyltransferase
MLDTIEIKIGSHVLFGPGFKLWNYSPLDAETRKTGKFSKAITIGDNCWMGGTIILPSVTIGNNCVIGAGVWLLKIFLIIAWLAKSG